MMAAMRMNNLYTFFLLITFLLLGQISFSQQFLKCGTKALSEDMKISNAQNNLAFQKFLKRHRAITKSKQTVDTIGISLHVIRTTQGQDITPLSEIKADIALTNEKYAKANMFFKLCSDIHYIDDSSTQPFGDATDERVIKSEDLNSNAVDIYYIGEFELEDLGGYFTQNSRGYYIVMGPTGGTTLAHELGHYYGLPHTHGLYNSEPPNYAQFEPQTNGFPTEVYVEGAVRFQDNQNDINGNQVFDCLETGDGVCDTPAEPVALGGRNNYDFRTCEYNGNLRDFYGDRYNPDPGNIMSYGFCIDFDEFFTEGQYEKIKFNLNRNRLSELCGFCEEEGGDRIVTNSESDGKGSLRWALSCDSKRNGTVNVRFQLPEGDERVIDIDARSFRILGDEINIDGKDITSGENITLRGTSYFLNGKNVNLSNITISDVKDENYGLIFFERDSRIALDNVTVGHCLNAIYIEKALKLDLHFLMAQM